jgi:Domain of Unknown Function (DUF1259)
MRRAAMHARALRNVGQILLSLVVCLAGCTQPKEAPSSVPAATAPPSLAPSVVPALAGPPLDAQLIGQRLGMPVTAIEGGGVRATLPRTDLVVTVDGAPLPRALGLGTSVVFRPAPHGAALSGEAALLEHEVSPVLDTLLAHGIQIVGLHNRFAFDEPRVMLLHFSSEGDPAVLASAVQSIGAAVRDAPQRAPTTGDDVAGDAPVAGALDARAIGGVLGVTASENGSEVLLTALRQAQNNASSVPPAPLLSAVMTGSDLHAAVNGTFTLTLPELLPVLNALRHANIHILALLPGELGQGPPSFLVYFGGKGTSLDLVRPLGLALAGRVDR